MSPRIHDSMPQCSSRVVMYASIVSIVKPTNTYHHGMPVFRLIIITLFKD